MKKRLFLLAAISGAVTAASASAQFYQVTVLTSNVPGAGLVTDANLVNAWGINFGGGPPWIADNGTGFSTLYGSTGIPNAKVVTIPPVSGSAAGTTSTPTGVVANTFTSGFNTTNGSTTAKSSFIFCTEDGTISSWANGVNPTNAFTAVDQSASNAVFKGLWTGTVSTGPTAGNYLYVANFHGASVETFNSSFGQVTTGFSFTDPSLPAGYAPFNIRTIGSSVYVAYAVQDALTGNHDETDGTGLGLVDVYDTSGNFLRRLTTGGTLDAPWGLAMAPAGFGPFSNDLLVGNFGDGTINAFNASSGAFQGRLQSAVGGVTTIDGLWGLDFGDGSSGFSPNTLYYAAGPQGETNGAFGSIAAVPEPTSAMLIAVAAPLLAARRRRR